MNIIVAGDFEKHDLVLTLGLLLQSHSEKKVVIITDNNRQYRHFDGECMGVPIREINVGTGDITLYDWHSQELPEVSDAAKIILATNYEKGPIEYGMQMQKLRSIDAILVVEQDCSITMKYIQAVLSTPGLQYEYTDGPQRRIDWVHEGKMDLKDPDKDFYGAVNDILVDICGIPKDEVKSLWNLLKKRG